ncbi:MAG: Mini-ribonuclease 3 [Peptostreptococcaceae bacterium]|jgi:ribonuclease-3 family protein|nr:Mini-ribonuclease 3 [Peptostreptococcaceae bacterium]
MAQNIEDKKNANLISPVVLAYMGDSVYEIYIRKHVLLNNINFKVNDIHKAVVGYVRASAQAKALNAIMDDLTEEELKIFKRGRNQKTGVPKNANVGEYRIATGFEALLGYLYIKNQDERLDFLIEKSIDAIESIG